jgi:hypothetical protein
METHHNKTHMVFKQVIQNPVVLLHKRVDDIGFFFTEHTRSVWGRSRGQWSPDHIELRGSCAACKQKKSDPPSPSTLPHQYIVTTR